MPACVTLCSLLSLSALRSGARQKSRANQLADKIMRHRRRAAAAAQAATTTRCGRGSVGGQTASIITALHAVTAKK